MSRPITATGRRRARMAKRYSLAWKRVDHLLTARLVEQLRNCKSEPARRLLLGISRKTTG